MGNALKKHQEPKSGEPDPPDEDDTSTFTCEICYEPMVSNMKYKNGSLCTHHFCHECIAKYIEVKIHEQTGLIECPGLACDHHLEPLSCRTIIPKSLFDKWCDLLCDSAVSSWDRCYCPYGDCSVLVLNECKDRLKKVDCPNCKKKFCFRCKIPWHAGYRCSESAQLRDRNDVLVGELIEERNWTRCYNCGHSVERISGCRFIKCKCGVLFCHRCGGRYHFGPCHHKYYRDIFCYFSVLIIVLSFCMFLLSII